ncbi:hypothetical protein L3Q82_017839 [Scortum barcoo]|uniref:Uncharacterized protein n=1 Tax=Scortum barcoo TaxID=214431 RepID=A0ACB8VM85_9TELE|nr:hypothetical protein L3Q82_017839 [Scortum barcoo]
MDLPAGVKHGPPLYRHINLITAPKTCCPVLPLLKDTCTLSLAPEREAMKDYIDSSLKASLIQPFPAGAGFFFVAKKDGSLHPCIDYSPLSEITRWMPFGLTNALAVFQAIVNDVLRDYLNLFFLSIWVKFFFFLPTKHLMSSMLKEMFTSAPILTVPDPQRQFVVEVDASNDGVGVVLSHCSAKDPTAEVNSNGGAQPQCACTDRPVERVDSYPGQYRQPPPMRRSYASVTRGSGRTLQPGLERPFSGCHCLGQGKFRLKPETIQETEAFLKANLTGQAPTGNKDGPQDRNTAPSLAATHSTTIQAQVHTGTTTTRRAQCSHLPSSTSSCHSHIRGHHDGPERR